MVWSNLCQPCPQPVFFCRLMSPIHQFLVRDQSGPCENSKLSFLLQTFVFCGPFPCWGSAVSASPADSHDPCSYHSRQNSPGTGGDNKYLFSFSPQLIPKPHPVPYDAPSKPSQKLVNILGGKFWHRDMIRCLRFLSPGLCCYTVL